MRDLRITLPDGTVAIVCGHFPRPKPCVVCGATSERLCDGKVPGARKRLKGCNAALCVVHAHADGPERDLCPSCLERRDAPVAAAPTSPPIARTADVGPPPQLALPLR